MDINTGDTAWVLMSAALVLLMTPGLAFFYGGMIRAKKVLNMMMMSFVTIGIVSHLWVLYGFTLPSARAATASSATSSFAGLCDIARPTRPRTTAPVDPIPIVFAAFQLMFAIITPALISGSIADRAKFVAWCVFVARLGHARLLPGRALGVRFGDADGGWLARKLGRVDFAGGTAVHINAGAAGLALAIVLGKRIGLAARARCGRTTCRS